MFKRRVKLLGKILLGLLVLSAALLLIERWRGQIALAGLLKQLRAAGVKLSPQDFTQTFNPADNGALEAVSAMAQLTNGTVLPFCLPPVMRVTSAGRAVVGFREPEWVESDFYRHEELIKGPITNSWPGLAADLETNAALLTNVITALQKPVVNHGIDFSAPLQLQVAHLTRAKSTATWFGAGAQLALREGQLTRAAESLVAQLLLLRALEEDRLAISELVRIAMAVNARAYTWEALQADGWADEDLAAIQAAWAKQSFASNMTHALEGELVFIRSSIREMRDSNNVAYDMLFAPYLEIFLDDESDSWTKHLEALPWGEELVAFGRRQIYCRLWRFAWSHQAEARMLRQMTQLIGLARSAATMKSYRDIEEDIQSLLAPVYDKNFYDRLRFPPPESLMTLSLTIKKALRAETDRSLVLTAIALKRCLLRHGSYPEQLNALVPEFMPAMPIDFMDGKPLKYRRKDEKSFLLYSVGEDGRDDGGDMSPPEGSSTKDLWRRRDYVWPTPATAEEVEEFRQETTED